MPRCSQCRLHTALLGASLGLVAELLVTPVILDARPARTAGGCVWTKEDLEKDPSAWERREEPSKRTMWCVSEANR